MFEHFERIEIISKTPRFYFDSSSAVSLAADANSSESIQVSAEIKHEEGGRIAVAIGDVFKGEGLQRVAPMPASDPKADKKRFKLGKLSKDKTSISEINHFPENTHVIVNYVYENDIPKVSGENEIADQRYTILSIQHAFIKASEKLFCGVL